MYSKTRRRFSGAAAAAMALVDFINRHNEGNHDKRAMFMNRIGTKSVPAKEELSHWRNILDATAATKIRAYA